MLKIALCEDEEIQAHITTTFIRKWGQQKEIITNITHYKSAEAFLFEWPVEKDFDIIFLDIIMKSMTGLDLAEKIREINERVIIIFITGLEQYMYRAFEVEALNYLIKPVHQVNMYKSLDMAWKKIQKNKDSNPQLVISKGKETYTINFKEIVYCTVFAHYIDIHTINNIYTYKNSMKELEKLLPNDYFIKCHRSYIINIQYIKKIIGSDIEMKNNIKIPLSRQKKELVREKLFGKF